MEATRTDATASGTNTPLPNSSPTSVPVEVSIPMPPPNHSPPPPNHSSPPPNHSPPPPPPTTTTTTTYTSPSPEIAKFSPSANKPPLYPSAPGSPSPGLIRRKTFNKTLKPKSRFGEPGVTIDSETLEIYGSLQNDFSSFYRHSPGGAHSSMKINRILSGKTPKPVENSARSDKDNKDGVYGPDEREVYRRVTAQLSARNQQRMTVKLLIQLFIFLCILGCLVASFTWNRMTRAVFLGLKLWKWFVFMMSIFSGMLVTHWFVHLMVFIIEWKFILQKNIVYFTHGLRTSVEYFLWIAVVLCTWVILFKPDIDSDNFPKISRFLDIVTWTIISLLIGSFVWLIKTTLIKTLAASFHLSRFFERIQESIFHHYVLQTLSGRPIMDWARKISGESDEIGGKVEFTEKVKSHKEIKVVDMAKLHQLKKDRVPSYTMQLLVDVVSNSGLSTLSGMIAEDVVEGGVELDDDEITSEEHAIATAVRIFENIVQEKLETEYIEKDDLLRFMLEEEVDLFFPLIEANEKGQLSLRAFSTWVVKVFKERLQLQHALNDNKTAVKQLNKVVTFILIVIMFVVWLLLTEIANTKLLLFFSSQLVVAAFIFGNTCKTIFEAIIFVFVMHPFDVGDRCLVDGTMMIVEEMNILTTVFLKVDKEKVYYPNAILSTKPISNYYRSPDNQGDWVEFSIHFATPVSKIGELKERIKNYLVSNPHFWRTDHFVIVREIENVNKLKMALFVNHTMNFQDFPEKTKRKSELVLEVKRLFEELDIKYHLLPQEVTLNNTNVGHRDTSMMMGSSHLD